MLTRNKALIYLSISAIVTGLSVAFSSYLGALAWVSLVPFVTVIIGLSEGALPLKRIYLYGLLFFELFYAVCFHWLTDMYPLSFTGLGNFASVIVIVLGLIGFPFLQALPSALAVALSVALMRSETAKRMRWLRTVALPCAWVLLEYVETLGAFGVPWARLSLSQADLIVPMAVASLFGSYAVSFVIVTVNVLAALALRSVGNVSASRKYAVAALAVFLINLGTGTALTVAARQNERAAETVRVGVVQGNHSSMEKWTDSAEEALASQLELARKCAEDGARIIVFAETAMPFPLNKTALCRKTLSDFASEYDVSLLVGALLYEDGIYCNAVYCVLPSGEFSSTVYVKRHLVPFGEYVPMEGFFSAFLPFLTEISVLSDPMTPGIDSEIFSLDEADVGSLICFDSIYESLVLDSVRDGAELLAVSTNDSWFRDSRGVYMHNNQSRLRAVELGRCVVRSANTGISSFISSTGAVISDISPLTRGYLTEDVPILTGRTLFSYVGNTFAVLSGITLLSPLLYEAVGKLCKKYKIILDNSTRGYSNDEK